MPRRDGGADPVTMRPARVEERLALDALMLRSKAHWDYDAAFLAACAPVLVVAEEAIAAGDVLVAQRGSDLVGVVAIAAVDDEPDEVELDVCFVEPAAIGTGVGRALVDAAIAAARARGAASMRVQSDPHAADFYAALGGVRVGETVSEVDPDRMLPLLRFDLTS